MSWLIGTAPCDVPLFGNPVSVRDVEEVATTSEALDQLDRQFGGDCGRGLAIKYLNKWVIPMLGGPSPAGVRRELFHAAAVLCEVIGYLAYATQLHGLAQRYFVQALRLANQDKRARYEPPGALYLDRPGRALTPAQTAQRGNAVLFFIRGPAPHMWIGGSSFF